MGLIAPPASAGVLARIRGILLGIALVVAVLGIGFGIVYGIAQPLGGLSVDVSIFYAIVLVAGRARGARLLRATAPAACARGARRAGRRALAADRGRVRSLHARDA